MKLHISNINGFNASKELLDAQAKISKVGIELGAYEMGIYTYPVDSDSDVEAGRNAGVRKSLKIETGEGKTLLDLVNVVLSY